MAQQIKIIAIGAIILSWLAVLSVGLLTLTPMIGDEVTHYYMLVTQAERLPVPCFEANIPDSSGISSFELRQYPHAFLWHYGGAILFRLAHSPVIVQIYQSLFLLQLLLVLLALARDVCGMKAEAVTLAVLVTASLPMVLIFSVAYYQDVPSTAQMITAFYLLMRKRWLSAAVFVAIAMSMKENMILFLPAYFILLVLEMRGQGNRQLVLSVVVSFLLILLSCFVMAWSIQKFVNGSYYPYDVLKVMFNRVYLHIPFLHSCQAGAGGVNSANGTPAAIQLATSLYSPNVIANHPGDLRNPANWLIYGGGILWLLLVAGISGLLFKAGRAGTDDMAVKRMNRLLFAGLSYLALAYLSIEAPEARFSIPGLVCCIIPLAGYAARLPGVKIWLGLFVVGAFLQTGGVLYKTFSLRHVPDGIKKAIECLRRNPPAPNRVFMYPEGNYRLFPCQHDWYLNYELRDLWRGNNDRRLELLRKFKIGAIVVKKHLVGRIDEKMNNLGVYPDYFVRDLDSDGRFSKVLDNRDVTIYRLPGIEENPSPKP